MKTTEQGQEAERVVAYNLKEKGFNILNLNWKTRVCEIDVVAERDKIIYFVEVKYRSRSDQGSGLDYITSKKLNQMHFAAQIWTQANSWDGDYRLMAAEVSIKGQSYIIDELIEV